MHNMHIATKPESTRRKPTACKSKPAGRCAPGQAGFSMIEVLISLVLIAVAMFGHAGLQLNAMKFAKGGATRMHAVFLSNELAERMEANRAGAIAGDYVIPGVTSTPTTAGSDCTAGECTAAALASYDLAEWSTRVAAALPGASWRVLQTAAGNPSTYTILVNWEERRANANSTTFATAGASDVLSLTSTKVVSQ